LHGDKTYNSFVCGNTNIISTDEDPGLRIESFAVINLRGVSTNKTIINVFLFRSIPHPRGHAHLSAFVPSTGKYFL
jgi:hypothetical protein